MNPFFRQKKDGRRAIGYPVYLLGGLAALAAFIALHRSTTSGGLGTARASRRATANVAGITQSAALMAPVSVPNRSAPTNARSYRIDQKESGSATPVRSPASDGQAPFNAVKEALADADSLDGGRSATIPAASPFALLPPAFSPEEEQPGKGKAAEKSDRSRLLDYRDKTANVGAPTAPVRESEISARAPEFILPRGTLIYVYLLTTVDSTNPAAVLQLAVAKPVVFNRRPQVDFGTRFLGRISGSPIRDRLGLIADTLLFPDGLELPANATAVEADEAGGNIRPGVAAYYFPPPQWAQMAPYVSDLFTGFMGLLESHAQQQFAVGVGGVTVQSGRADDPRAPLYQASAQAIQDFTQARLHEIERRYADCYLIPAGSAFWLQLNSDLDLRAAHPAARLARRPYSATLPLSADSSVPDAPAFN